MVRRLNGTSAGFQRRLGKELLRVGTVGRFAQPSEDFMDRKGRGIHRVVRAGITDLSMDVQVLSREHSARGADALAGGLREEGGRVERRRRRLPMFASRDSLHGCGLASKS